MRKGFDFSDYEMLLELAWSGIRDVEKEIAKAMSLGEGGLPSIASSIWKSLRSDSSMNSNSELVMGFFDALSNSASKQEDLSEARAKEVGKALRARLVEERNTTNSVRLNDVLFHLVERGGSETKKIMFAMRVFMEAGANPNAKGEGGEPALIKAVQGGMVGMAKLLVECGAELSGRNRYGETALHAAALTNYEPMISALCEAGADLEARSHAGETPLLAAVKSGRAKAVERLLELGADPNASFKENSILLAAALREETEVVAAILSFGGSLAEGEAERVKVSEASGSNEALEMVSRMLLEKSLKINLRKGFESKRRVKA